MARFAISGRTSAVPTAARGPAVYGTAAVRPQIKEVGVFNTTAVACAVALVRATATGTKGAALTPVCSSDSSNVAIATGSNTHTADATVGSVPVRQASLGAAIGSGMVWVFDDGEFVVDGAATTAGMVITCPTGTGQHLDFYIVWRE